MRLDKSVYSSDQPAVDEEVVSAAKLGVTLVREQCYAASCSVTRATVKYIASYTNVRGCSGKYTATEIIIAYLG